MGVWRQYSKYSSMLGKSDYISELLIATKINPAQTYKLEDFLEDDSPEDVGLFINGIFFSYDKIRKEIKGIKKELKKARKDSRVVVREYRTREGGLIEITSPV